MAVQSRRKIAMCVSTWSAESTLYMWNYVKQYLLRRQHSPEGAVLRDQLYIVHVHSPKQGGNRKSTWQAGGALMHSLQDSLEKYPHTIVELTASNVTAATLDWAEGEGIDILVMGFRDAKVKAAMTKVIPGEWGLGSTSGRTLQHTKLPLLIVRPDAALKLNKLRIQQPSISPAAQQQEADQVAAAPALGTKSVPALVRTLSPGRLATFAPNDTRKVGIAFEQEEAGANMLRWAAGHLLQATDQVFLVRVVSGSPAGPASALESVLVSGPGLRAHVSGGTELPGAAADAAPIRKELDSFDVVLNTQMQGDPRERICSFAKEEGLDILMVGRSLGSRFKKAFTPGGTVSQHVVSNAACPVLVYPAKAHGANSPDFPLSPRERRASLEAQPSLLRRGGTGGAGGGPASPTATAAAAGDPNAAAEVQQLRTQLREREAEVAALKEQIRLLQLGKQAGAAGAEAAAALAADPTAAGEK